MSKPVKTAAFKLPNMNAPSFAQVMFAGDSVGAPKPPTMSSAKGNVQNAPKVEDVDVSIKQPEQIKEASLGKILANMAFKAKAVGRVAKGAVQEGYKTRGAQVDRSSGFANLMRRLGGAGRHAKDEGVLLREGFRGGRGGHVLDEGVSKSMKAGHGAGRVSKNVEKGWSVGRAGGSVPDSAPNYVRGAAMAGRNPGKTVAAGAGAAAGLGYLFSPDGEPKHASADEQSSVEKRAAMSRIVKGLLGTSALGGAYGLGYLTGKERYDETALISESLPGGQWALSAMSLPHQKRVRKLIEQGKHDEASQMYKDLLTSGEAIRAASSASSLRKTGEAGIVRMMKEAGPTTGAAVRQHPGGAGVPQRAPAAPAYQAVVPHPNPNDPFASQPQAPAAVGGAQQGPSVVIPGAAAPPADPAGAPPAAPAGAPGASDEKRQALAPQKGGSGGGAQAQPAYTTQVPAQGGDPFRPQPGSRLHQWLNRSAQNEGQRKPAPRYMYAGR